jgi:hypothetical protein
MLGGYNNHLAIGAWENMRKIASNLKFGLKFETDNVRQRSCVGEIAPSVARPTLTHKEGEVRRHANERKERVYHDPNQQTRK